jgi:hypothetical protein
MHLPVPTTTVKATAKDRATSSPRDAIPVMFPVGVWLRQLHTMAILLVVGAVGCAEKGESHPDRSTQADATQSDPACQTTAECTKIKSSLFCFDGRCTGTCPSNREICGSLMFPRGETTTCCNTDEKCCAIHFESGKCSPKGTASPPYYDDARVATVDRSPYDTLEIRCVGLDAYEGNLCITNINCVMPTVCPTFAPIKCVGAWRCIDNRCAYKCPP